MSLVALIAIGLVILGIASALDKPKCPVCKNKLDGKPRYCPYCNTSLTWRN